MPKLSPIWYAIGDLGVARRHMQRLRDGILQPTPMVMEEISASIERCVERLEQLDDPERAHIPLTTS
jgi:hypothetical protein